jgi:hypothetical protein
MYNRSLVRYNTKKTNQGLSVSDITDLDPILEEIIRLMRPIADRMSNEEDRALLLIGVRYHPDSDGVETALVSTGYLSVLAEGVYTELASQIEKGNPELFMVLRQVVHDLEIDLNIPPDEDAPNGSSALH